MSELLSNTVHDATHDATHDEKHVETHDDDINVEGNQRVTISSDISDNENSHSESESESDSDSDVEYEEIDLTDNPLYQVLSTLFEDEEGNNLCTIMKSLVKSVDSNTKALNKLLKKN